MTITTHTDQASTVGAEQSNDGLDKLANWAREIANPKRAIINPWADALLFWGAPVWCLLFVVLGAQIPNLWLTNDLFGGEYGYITFLTGSFTSAHLLAVVFRSHLNPTVFQRWPMRFTVVPIALFALLAWSPWALVAASAIAIFWDVYHSGMQNFGLARIFDARAGNPPEQGRLLDSLISQVLYAGPIGAGASLFFHFEGFESFEEFLPGGEFSSQGDGAFALVAEALTTVPASVDGMAEYIRAGVIVVSAIAWFTYILGYYRLSRQGYNVAPQKVMLMASTAMVSVIAWTFSEPVIAFAVMNLFHAVQYFAIVWGREQKTMAKTFKLKSAKHAKWIVLAFIGVVCFAFSTWEMLWANAGWDALYAAILSVALLHFWYDGFIWSVRAKHV